MSRLTEHEFREDIQTALNAYIATLEELDSLSEDNNNLLHKLEKYQDTEREKLEILEECEKLKCHNQLLEESLSRSETERCELTMKAQEIERLEQENRSLVAVQQQTVLDIQRLNGQLNSAKHYVNEVNAKLQTERQIRVNTQKQLDSLRNQVQKLATEKKHYLEQIQSLRNESRTHLSKVKQAENETRKYRREVDEFQECKIKLEKLQDMLEINALENNELQRELLNLRKHSRHSRTLSVSHHDFEIKRDPSRKSLDMDSPRSRHGSAVSAPSPTSFNSPQTEIVDWSTAHISPEQQQQQQIDNNDNSTTQTTTINLLQKPPPQTRRIRSMSLAEELEECKNSPSTSPSASPLRRRSNTQTAEDYLLMSARAVKIQYPEVDISFEQLVNMARGLKFWEVYPFYMRTMKTLKLKDDGIRAKSGQRTANLFSSFTSFFNRTEDNNPTTENRRPTATGKRNSRLRAVSFSS